MLRFDSDSHKITMVVKDTGTLTLRISNYTLDDGDEVILSIDKERENKNPLIQKRITQFTDGKATIILTKEDTDVKPGDYYYDIQVNTADGRVDTVVGPAKFKFEGGMTY